MDIQFRDFVITRGSPVSPCKKDCERRAWDCHFAGHCPDYDAYREACEEMNRERAKQHLISDYVSATIEKTKKRCGKK